MIECIESHLKYNTALGHCINAINHKHSGCRSQVQTIHQTLHEVVKKIFKFEVFIALSQFCIKIH